MPAFACENAFHRCKQWQIDIATVQLPTKEITMLQQIIDHTPLWVWAILAFLISRGMQASRDREVPLRSVFIIPVVMLVLALQGMANAFGISVFTVLPWAVGAIAGSAFAWSRSGGGKVRVLEGGATVFLRGSWAPLILMLAIFVTKYAVAVMLAVQPALHGSLAFSAVVCAAYGVFNGLFNANVLRVLSQLGKAQTQPSPSGN
jgi:hypothetical protein